MYPLKKTVSAIAPAGETDAVGILLVGGGVLDAASIYAFELYQYDALNRLVKSDTMAGTAEYAYNAAGLRVSKAVNGVATKYVWDGGQIATELNGSGTVLARYTRGIGLIKSDTAWYLFNAHGDVIQIANSTGAVTRDYDYDAFGIEGSPDSVDANPFRYAGEYYDRETGTYYLRARYYSPGTGRFITEDPIRDGLNWYTYSGANPIMFIDPTGLYNREAAVNYVLDWYDSHNPAYLSMESMAATAAYLMDFHVFLGLADCTNFTSQALLAGEIGMNDSWHYYQHENKLSFWWSLLSGLGNYRLQFVTPDGDITTSPMSYDFTGPWALANEQYKYFSDPDNGFIDGSVLTIRPNSELDILNALESGVQVGDMLYWSWDGDGFVNHSSMITEIVDGEIHYGAHTTSREVEDLFDALGGYPEALAYIVRILDDAN